MTPEQLQEKVEFIIESQAISSTRLDRVEITLGRLTEDLELMKAEQDDQRDKIDRLIVASRNLLDLAKADRDAAIARLEATRAEIAEDRKRREQEMAEERERRKQEMAEERERRKQTEGRVDGIEEMTKLLRELLEGRLRPPDTPPRQN
jgi:hypothetical protein